MSDREISHEGEGQASEEIIPPPSPRRNTAPVAGRPKPLKPISPVAALLPPSKLHVVPPEPDPALGDSFRLSEGDRVSHYELIRLIGSGGMGHVWQCRDEVLGRRAAIKFLHTEDPEERSLFLREARATARCAHENIVAIYEVGEHKGHPYMVLEKLTGRVFSNLLADCKPMRASRAVELIVPVLRALVFAHARGVVHRDLKPANVMLCESGQVKVLDWGIAKAIHLESTAPADVGASPPMPLPRQPSELDLSSIEKLSITQSGTLVGTPGYMAPERFLHQEADPRSDLWAVGIMLFQMLSGRHPLDSLGISKVREYARVAEPGFRMPSLLSRAPNVDSELAAVVDKCLLPLDERFQDAESVLKALEPFLPVRPTRAIEPDQNPYIGLVAFKESDADRFYGRDVELGRLIASVRDRPLTAVVGASGVGKSSVVRAGVVPALRLHVDEPWDAVVIRPGRNPLAALANCVASWAGTRAPITSSTTIVAADLQLDAELTECLRTKPGYAGQVARAYARRRQRNLLIVFDQFEELYTQVPDEQTRRAFTACIASLADDGDEPTTRVLVSMRTDFLDRVGEDPELLAEVTRGLFFLGPPTREGLRDALVEPAQAAGFRFETDAIVGEMLAHLDVSPGSLPLLQFTASQLWLTRDVEAKTLTKASYDAIGGVAGALARHADTVVGDLSPELREAAKGIFLRLITPERTHAIRSLQELREEVGRGDVDRVIEHLVQARLLVTRKHEHAVTVEIIHESLVTSWPTLAHWVTESGADAAFSEQLRTAAKQWQANNRDNDLLWRGDLVEDARRFQKRFQGGLSPTQQAFLEAVFAHQTRAARRRRALALGGVASLSALALAASIGFFIVHRAHRAAVIAKAEAQRNLETAVVKERERAEAARRAEAAKEEVKRANEDLQAKNEQLADALRESQAARKEAEEARAKAEESAKAEHHARSEAEASSNEAKRARDDARAKEARAQRSEREARRLQTEATRAKEVLEVALQREKERVRRLRADVGTPGLERAPWTIGEL